MKKLTFFLLSILIGLNVFTQTTNDNDFVDNEDQIKRIAPYFNADSEILDNTLLEIGFEIPKYFNKKEWPRLPVYTKLVIVCTAAENHTDGNGAKALALMSKSMAQEYESLGNDPRIQLLLSSNLENEIVEFKNFPNYPIQEIASIDQATIRKIHLLSSYLDQGALGGLSEVLFTYFDFDEIKIHSLLAQERMKDTRRILLEATAQIKGIRSADNILQDIYKDLCTNYEAPRFDSKLTRAFDNIRLPNEPVNRIIDESISNQQIDNKTKLYQDFLDHHYPKSEGREFRRMIIKRGFGGVIFGDAITSTIDEKLTAILWRSNSTPQQSSSYGRLEFIFADNQRMVYRNVHAEDLRIINALFKSNSEYIKTEGLGLVSIGSSFFFTHDKKGASSILLHPDVVNSSLANALVYVDLYPRYYKAVSEESPQRMEEVSAHYREDTTSVLLFTDMPVNMRRAGNSINVYSEHHFDQLNLTLNQGESEAIGTTIYEEARRFNELLPGLIETDYAFGRVNEFAKLFSLLKWAARQQVSIPEHQQPRNHYYTPDFFCETDNGDGKFRDIAEEISGYEKKEREVLSRLNETTVGFDSVKLNSHYLFLAGFSAINEVLKEDFVKINEFYNGEIPFDEFKINDPEEIEKMIAVIEKLYMVEGEDKWLESRDELLNFFKQKQLNMYFLIFNISGDIYEILENL